MSTDFEKIVVVTRKTRLQELIERFNTKTQAKFYLEHAGGDFADYATEDDTYRQCVERVLTHVNVGVKLHCIDRTLVPTYFFAPTDLIVTIGQDGIVANCAKYVGGQPILAVNPDPERFDGILLPFTMHHLRPTVEATLAHRAAVQRVTLARVTLNDGQTLLAFNDFFLGAQSHVSARYRIGINRCTEAQSSSGLIVSTGAGSTGWLSSICNMAAGLTKATGGTPGKRMQLTWDDRRLFFAVREPFVSKHSHADVVSGVIADAQELVVESMMPSNGVIFSDGVESDYLAFNAGFTAKIRAADQRATLVVAASSSQPQQTQRTRDTTLDATVQTLLQQVR